MVSMVSESGQLWCPFYPFSFPYFLNFLEREFILEDIQVKEKVIKSVAQSGAGFTVAKHPQLPKVLWPEGPHTQV